MFQFFYKNKNEISILTITCNLYQSTTINNNKQQKSTTVFTMLINNFDSKIENRSVDTIIVQTERTNKQDKYIDLNPVYQRDIVWDDLKQSEFINSVMRGIVPNNLILNYDLNAGKETCLDGKQRITSLTRFKKSEIPVKITQDDDTEEYYFFEKIPSVHQEKQKYKVFTPYQRNSFLNKSLTFVIYYNLTYDDQVDIFTRIQHGLALTEGEKLSSVIVKEDVNILFNSFCNSKKQLLSKFSSKREQHKIVVTNILIISKNSKLQVPSKITRTKFLQDRTDLNSFKKLLNSLSPFIDFVFSKDILNHSTIDKKLSQNILYSVIFWLLKHKYDLYHKNLINNSTNQKKLRSVIRNLHKSNRTKKNNSDILNTKKLENIKDSLLKNFKNILEDDLTDEENCEEYSETIVKDYDDEDEINNDIHY